MATKAKSQRGRRGECKASQPSKKKPKNQVKLFQCWQCQETRPRDRFVNRDTSMHCFFCREKQMEREEKYEAWFKGFECPGWGSDSLTAWGLDSLTEVEVARPHPHLTFHQTTPVRKDLVGTYDMVYYASRGDEEYYHRKMTGRTTMLLEWKDDDEHMLVGHVTPEFNVRPFDGMDFEFTAEKEVPYYATALREFIMEDGCLTYIYPGISDDPADFGCLGVLKVVAAREATRWLADSLRFKDSETTKRLRNSIEFTTNEEADALLREYNNFHSFKWISNHTILSEEVASLVSQFARSKPTPVFFFEEGDLWLQTEWPDPEDPEDSKEHSVMVFRRRADT